MNEFVDLLKGVVYVLSALAAGAFGWFIKRQSDRIDALERHYVTREELEKSLAQLASMRMAQHQENRETLLRMESKLDSNEEKAAKTRHDTLDQVHALGLKIATFSGKRE